MSLAGARAELVARLNTVTGIKAKSARPATIAVGSAWPIWRGWSLSDGSTGLMISEWQVYVAVGSNELAATDFVDERLADLMDALQPAGWVTAVVPYEIVTDAGSIFAVQITITRE